MVIHNNLKLCSLYIHGAAGTGSPDFLPKPGVRWRTEMHLLHPCAMVKTKDSRIETGGLSQI